MHPTSIRSRVLSALVALAATACHFDNGDPPPTELETPPAGSEQAAGHGSAQPLTNLPRAAAPLDVGAVVPAFRVANATQTLDSHGPLAGGPLVLVFYIGDFCQYCRRQLSGLQARLGEFTALHATVWGVSADSMDVSSGLTRDLALAFPLGSDQNLDLIRAFGVESEGTNTARPAVFVLAPDPGGGRVVFRQVGANQADRAAIDDVLAAVRAAASPSPRPQ